MVLRFKVVNLERLCASVKRVRGRWHGTLRGGDIVANILCFTWRIQALNCATPTPPNQNDARLMPVKNFDESAKKKSWFAGWTVWLLGAHGGRCFLRKQIRPMEQISDGPARERTEPQVGPPVRRHPRGSRAWNGTSCLVQSLQVDAPHYSDTIYLLHLRTKNYLHRWPVTDSMHHKAYNITWDLRCHCLTQRVGNT